MSAQFDGSTNAIIRDPTGIGLTTTVFSICAWTKIFPIPANTSRSVVSIRNVAGNDRALWEANNNGNSGTFLSVLDERDGNYIVDCEQFMETGAWYFIGQSFNGDASAGYMRREGQPNFVLTGSNSQAFTFDTFLTLYLGCFDPGSENFGGLITSVRLWDSTALTQAQFLAESQSNTPCIPGVWDYWPLTASLTASNSATHDFASAGAGVSLSTDEPSLGIAQRIWGVA